MTSFLYDLRFAWRQLLRTPAFAAVAVGTLALGIGANATIFSIVNAVLLRPLPYPRAEQLYLIRGAQPALHTEGLPLSLPNFEDMEGSRSFAAIAATRPLPLNLTEGATAERAEGCRVTDRLPEVLGVAPYLGRAFTPDENRSGGPAVAVLSHAFWTRRFGSDPRVVGHSIGLDGRKYLVVGVMPRGFAYPNPDTEIWIPMQKLKPEEDRGRNFIRVVGRLRAGVSRSQAAAEIATIGRRLEREYPATNEGTRFYPAPLQDEIIGAARRNLWILQAAAAVLLGIACVNVANLLLVRAAGRRNETAIRTALGAGRRRLASQFLTESLLLGILGGAAGIAIAAVATAFLRRLPEALLPRAQELSLDGRVLLFGFAASALTALVFGIAPALRGTGRGIAETLKSGGRGSSRGGADQRILRTLVVCEIALALVLASGAGLLLRSYRLLSRVDPGFDTNGLWTAAVGLASSRYPSPEKQERYYREATARLASVRGVRSASVVARLPLVRFGTTTSFTLKGRPVANGSEPNADFLIVGPACFATLKIPIFEGREFTDRDDAAAKEVVVINRVLARQYWPGESPIGKFLQIGADRTGWREVVGVVGDVKLYSLQENTNPTMYCPLTQNPYAGHLRSASFVARFEPGSDAATTAGARQELARYDPEQAVMPFQPMAQVVSGSLAPRRLNLHLTMLFGLLAAALAAIGIYGVMAHAVGERRREIGIRMALGADRSDVARLVLRQGAGLAAMGIVAGILVSLPLMRLLSTLLFGVGAADPAVYASVCLLVLAVAAVAVAIPARRAARTDPLVALQAG
ncbi:MAG: ABC transporter permease [Acidobacteriota bacterium]